MPLHENLVVADRFRLVRIIGRGGMGSVWQAVHLALDQPCAVKFIEGEVANVADAHARFEREAKAAAQLRSPHVVQILDHGVWQGQPYIAMELLEGEDLGRAMSRGSGKLPYARINSIMQQVCRALTKAHQAGVVHRDLKPDNIFLITDDDRELVKILDFGVAKSTGQAIDGSNTKTGAMLGTPYYMSPEQAQGIKTVDSRSDLWSLAVIVYQCITGYRPFDSEALGDLLVKIIVHPVPVPSQVTTGVPPEFDRWWAKAAARNPEHRFQTAKEFSNSLAMALGLTHADPNNETKPLHQPPAPMAAAGAGHRTAMMVQTPQSHPVPTNPNPGGAPNLANTGNTGPHAISPASRTNSPSVPPGNGGLNNNTPNNAHTAAFSATPQPQHQQQSPHQASQNLSATNNPATFGGVEPPASIPKKNMPVAVLAGMGGLLVFGLVIGGGSLMMRRAASTTTPPTPSATESTAVSSSGAIPTTTASEAASAAPTTSETAAVPSASAAASASSSSEVVASSANTKSGVGGGNPTPHSGQQGIVAPKASTPTTGTAIKTTTPPAAASSARGFGDRKW